MNENYIVAAAVIIVGGFLCYTVMDSSEQNATTLNDLANLEHIKQKYIEVCKFIQQGERIFDEMKRGRQVEVDRVRQFILRIPTDMHYFSQVRATYPEFDICKQIERDDLVGKLDAMNRAMNKYIEHFKGAVRQEQFKNEMNAGQANMKHLIQDTRGTYQTQTFIPDWDQTTPAQQPPPLEPKIEPGAQSMEIVPYAGAGERNDPIDIAGWTSPAELEAMRQDANNQVAQLRGADKQLAQAELDAAHQKHAQNLQGMRLDAAKDKAEAAKLHTAQLAAVEKKTRDAEQAKLDAVVAQKEQVYNRFKKDN